MASAIETKARELVAWMEIAPDWKVKRKAGLGDAFEDLFKAIADADTESEINKAYREAASELHGCDGECEIDDDAVVSDGADEGAYVAAWVWVPWSQVDAICDACGEFGMKDDECPSCAEDAEDEGDMESGLGPDFDKEGAPF